MIGRKRIGVFLALALAPVLALADRVFWGCNYGEPRILRSGPIVCRQEVRQCWNMTVTCSRGSDVLFTANDFADVIAATEDGRYIVGLSNRGSENAYWVRDSQGRAIASRKHSGGAGIDYCRESVTNVREWYDGKRPDVRFEVRGGRLVQVLVRGCGGKDVPLLR